MRILSNLSLRQMLTVPYVVLVLLAAAIIGLLSYKAGSKAVDTLSEYFLTETVNRIAQAVQQHIAGSEAVLETAFPTDVPAPESVNQEMQTLRTRLWLATTIHRDPTTMLIMAIVKVNSSACGAFRKPRRNCDCAPNRIRRAPSIASRACMGS
jgi:hypothetical protein